MSFTAASGWESASDQKIRKDSQINYARMRLDSALLNAGHRLDRNFQVSILSDSASEALPSSARFAEGFHISIKNGEIKIVGYDKAGAFYGTLELAKQIEQNGKLPPYLDFSDAPVMKQRGVCILLMKLGSYNYPITPEEFPFFYDKKLWLEYLDFLANNRFNYVAFWNGHPFDYFVKLDKYPEAQQGMPPGLLQKNHDMLHWLCNEGAKRNIRFLFEFYNIHTSVYFQKAHSLPSEISVPTPLLENYTAYSIEKFLGEFPDVGLYVTLGEALNKKYADYWMNRVILPAVNRAGTKPTIFVRSWFIELEHARKFAQNYPNLYFERKYNVEMIADTLVDPENAEWAKLTSNLIVNIHMAANLEPFRWHPPTYIRKCLQSAQASGANGLHLYPRKSWRWPYGCDRGEPQLQWHRDALWFEMWGRYAWNPDRPADLEHDYWCYRLKEQFGSSESSEHFLRSFEVGADVLPAIQRLVWLGYDNHTVVAAGAKLIQMQDAEGCPFLSLSGTLRIPHYLDAITRDRQPKGKSPLLLLAEKAAAAKTALEEAHLSVQAATKNQGQAKRFENDARAIYHIVQFYFHKLEAVEAKVLCDNQVDANENQQRFLTALKASLHDFRALTELTDSSYESISDVPARHPERLKKCPYHWRDVLPIYEKEFEIYERQFQQPVNANFFKPGLPGLAGIFYGDPDLKNADEASPAQSLEWDWNEKIKAGMGRNWSIQWFGFIKAPQSGTVVFSVRSDRGVTLEVNSNKIIDWTGNTGEQKGAVELQKGQLYPIEIIYNHAGGDEGYLNIQWRWQGQEKEAIPPNCLSHSPAQKRRMDEATLLLQNELR